VTREEKFSDDSVHFGFTANSEPNTKYVFLLLVDEAVKVIPFFSHRYQVEIPCYATGTSRTFFLLKVGTLVYSLRFT